MRSGLIGFWALVVLLAVAAPFEGQMTPGHPVVEASGVKPAIKLQEPVQGFMTALNGNIDLRASEVEFEPGGAVKDHYHFGPGIRRVLEGELTLVYVDTGNERVVRAGDYFYESGEINIWAVNRGTVPAKLLIVELVPAGLKGSAMAPPAGRPALVASGAHLKELVCSKK